MMMDRNLAERMSRLIHSRTGENVMASPAIFGGRIEYWVVASTVDFTTYYLSGAWSAQKWKRA